MTLYLYKQSYLAFQECYLIMLLNNVFRFVLFEELTPIQTGLCQWHEQLTAINFLFLTIILRSFPHPTIKRVFIKWIFNYELWAKILEEFSDLGCECSSKCRNFLWKDPYGLLSYVISFECGISWTTGTIHELPPPVLEEFFAKCRIFAPLSKFSHFCIIWLHLQRFRRPRNVFTWVPRRVHVSTFRGWTQ